MNDKCRGFMGRIRCNFEERRDALPVTPDHIRAMGEAFPVSLNLEAGSTYVCDVCTACGEVRERPATPGKGTSR